MTVLESSKWEELHLKSLFLAQNVLIVKIFGSDSLHIYTPSLVKKTAGKGNANKDFMFESFKSNVLEDELLADNNFFKYTCSKEKLGKPLDDLIDSYFIVKTHELSS